MTRAFVSVGGAGAALVLAAVFAVAPVLPACGATPDREAPCGPTAAGAGAGVGSDVAPPGDDAAARSDAAPAGEQVVSLAGSWRVVYTTAPAPIPLNAPFDVRAWVFDAHDGRRRDDVGLVVDAGMPQHRHGMNRTPRHTRLPGGGMLAEGLLFHMPGEWTLTFDVSDAGITERAEVTIQVGDG